MMRRMKIKAAPNLLGGSKKVATQISKPAVQSPISSKVEPTKTIVTNEHEHDVLSVKDFFNSLNVKDRETALKENVSFTYGNCPNNEEVVDKYVSPFSPLYSSEKMITSDKESCSKTSTILHTTAPNVSSRSHIKESKMLSMENLNINSACLKSMYETKLINENSNVSDSKTEPQSNQHTHKSTSDFIVTTTPDDAIKKKLVKNISVPNPIIERRNRIKARPVISMRRKSLLCKKPKTVSSQVNEVSTITVEPNKKIDSIREQNAPTTNSDINCTSPSTKGSKELGNYESKENILKNSKLSQLDNKRLLNFGCIKKENILNKHNVFYERKLNFKKKVIEGPLEKNKLTMFDLIFWNPPTNPMPPMPESREQSRNRSNSQSTTNATSLDASYEQEIEESGLLPNSIDNGDSKKEQGEKSSELGGDGDEETLSLAPQVRIGPDGELMIDEKSIMIETTAVKNRDQVMKNTEVIEESIEARGNGYSRYNKKRKRSQEWTIRETARFYKALASVGTDFSLMTSILKWRSRAELKIKFKKEERINRHLIDCALNDCTQFDFSLFEESDYDPEEDRKAVKEEAKLRYSLLRRKMKEEKASKKKQRKSKAEQKIIEKARAKRLRRLKNNHRKRKEYHKRKSKAVSNTQFSKEIKVEALSHVPVEQDINETDTPQIPNENHRESVSQPMAVQDSDDSKPVPLSERKGRNKSKKSRQPRLKVSSRRKKKDDVSIKADEIICEVIVTSNKNSVSLCTEPSSTVNQSSLTTRSENVSNINQRENLSDDEMTEEIELNSNANDVEPECCSTNKELNCYSQDNGACASEDPASDRISVVEHTPNSKSENNGTIPPIVKELLEMWCDSDEDDTPVLCSSTTVNSKSFENLSAKNTDLESSQFNIVDSSLKRTVNEKPKYSLVLDQCTSVTSIPISIDTELYSKVCAEMNVGFVNKETTYNSESQITSNIIHEDSVQQPAVDEEVSTFFFPAKEIRKSEFGESYVLIDADFEMKKRIPVPSDALTGESIIVMATPNPKNPMERMYHVYTVASDADGSSFKNKLSDISKCIES